MKNEIQTILFYLFIQYYQTSWVPPFYFWLIKALNCFLHSKNYFLAVNMWSADCRLLELIWQKYLSTSSLSLLTDSFLAVAARAGSNLFYATTYILQPLAILRLQHFIQTMFSHWCLAYFSFQVYIFLRRKSSMEDIALALQESKVSWISRRCRF